MWTKPCNHVKNCTLLPKLYCPQSSCSAVRTCFPINTAIKCICIYTLHHPHAANLQKRWNDCTPSSPSPRQPPKTVERRPTSSVFPTNIVLLHHPHPTNHRKRWNDGRLHPSFRISPTCTLTPSPTIIRFPTFPDVGS